MTTSDRVDELGAMSEEDRDETRVRMTKDAVDAKALVQIAVGSAEEAKRRLRAAEDEVHSLEQDAARAKRDLAVARRRLERAEADYEESRALLGETWGLLRSELEALPAAEAVTDA